MKILKLEINCTTIMVVVSMQLDETDKKIIEYLTRGKIYKEISHNLKITIPSIKYRIKAMKQYYRVNTLPELIYKIMQTA